MLVDAAGMGRLFGTAVDGVWAWVRPSRRKTSRDSIVVGAKEIFGKC